MLEEGLPLPIGFVARAAVRVIPLNHGQYSLVDAGDFEWLSQFTWNYDRIQGYALHNNQRMHRYILGLAPGELGDHINLDKLDNRRSNLRRCTRTENNRNCGPRKNNPTGFKGVHFHKKHQRFTACITVNRHRMHIGIYDTAREAAIAYDDAAREHFGEFAYLNFPNGAEKAS